MRLILSLCAALALTACSVATPPPAPVSAAPVAAAAPVADHIEHVVDRADVAVERAAAAYAEIRGAADAVLPLLPEDLADRVRAVRAVADRALDVARSGVTAAKRLAALRELERAARQLSGAAR